MHYLAATALFVSLVSAQNDLDRDTIPDELEQQLLVKFAPTFMVSEDDCDGLPAEFMEGQAEPRVIAKSGVVYGQVFKHGEFIEIHYHLLWSRDCGSLSSHAWDPEHVSVLVSTEGKALYWYAAAHEDTVCDASSGARAANLRAENHGTTVWISRGKHASFLTEESCRLGCGGDRCRKTVELKPPRIINLGEQGAPLHGSSWISSKKLALAAKMRTDFDDRVLAKLDASERFSETPVNDALPPIKAIILGGNSGLIAASTGNRHGAKALLLGLGQGVKGAGLALKKTGSALRGIFDSRN